MDESQVTDATQAPIEPTAATDSAPIDTASAPSTPEPAPEVTATPAAEEAAPAPAAEPAPAPVESAAPIEATVEEPPIRPLGTSGQSPEAAVANNGPAPVGKVIVQKTIKELEDELDGGAFASIEDFIKTHWETQDANVQRLAMVLRMETTEVWDIIKGFGVKLSQGM